MTTPEDAWDHWWWENRLRFLELQRHRHALQGPVTGPSNHGAATIGADQRERIGTLLHRILAEGSPASAHEITAAMVTAAKLSWKPAETRALLVLHLRSPVQEVRETAATTLGLLGDPEAASLLIALLLDQEHARILCGTSSVDDRTRAFAGYGLALLARRNESERAISIAEMTKAALLQVLDGSSVSRPELEAAALCALGVLPLPEESRMEIAPLLEQIGRDERRQTLVRAQVPTAQGRLLGSVATEALAVRIEDERSDWLVRDSAELASGALAGELLLSQRQRLTKALDIARARGKSPGERAFAILSLARLQEPAALRSLVRDAVDGAHLDKPWIALGLGFAARSRAELAEDPTELLRALREGYRRTKAAEVRSAYAIALGLARDLASSSVLRRDLASSGISTERGHLAIALGLMGDIDARPLLRELYLRATREPEEGAEIAIGMMLLGDLEAIPHLLHLLAKARTTARLCALATNLGLLGGPAACKALLELAADESRTALVRAYAVVGLGHCIEDQDLPWTAPFAADFNYLSAPATLSGGDGLLQIL